MKFTIRSVPRFEFELTREQLVMLTRASTLHYDATCRSLSGPWQPGTSAGLLVGWNNIKQSGHLCPEWDPPTLEATWRELDLCLKCMEFPLPDRAYEKERVRTTLAFRQMMDAWEAHHKALGKLEGETK